MVFKFRPNPFNRRAKLTLARKTITAIVITELIKRIKLSRRAICQRGQSGKSLSMIDVASEAVLSQISNGIKGRYIGILFRRGDESAKAFLHRDVFSSQPPNSTTPVRKRIRSMLVISLVSCLAISGIFIVIYFLRP